MKILSKIPIPITIITFCLFDISALLFVFVIPYLSRFTGIPLYIIEPMRLVVILAIAHTNRWNSLLLAIILPFFMFVTAMHPSVYKTVLVSIELLINVGLFYLLLKCIKNPFISMLTSIIAGKFIYYGLKYLVISAKLIEGDLIATPIIDQVITSLIFSGYIFIILRRKGLKAQGG